MEKILIAAIAVITALVTAAAFILYRKFVRTDENVFGIKTPDELLKWLEKTKHKDTYMVSDDGICLHGIVIDNDSDNWVVLVHGYDSEAEGMLGYAQKFLEKGYSIFLPDCRGFGSSGGGETSMGHFESKDLVKWTYRLSKETGAKNIVLLGVSMGASTVMLTAAEKLPENVRAAIEDCGYTSVREEYEYQMPYTAHLPPYPVLWAVDLITRLKSGWSILKDADCVSAVRRARIPICFIHGEEDKFVPYRMHRKLYDACPRDDKEMLTVSGAAHTESCGKDPEKYWQTVFGFIEKHII